MGKSEKSPTNRQLIKLCEGKRKTLFILIRPIDVKRGTGVKRDREGGELGRVSGAASQFLSPLSLNFYTSKHLTATLRGEVTQLEMDLSQSACAWPLAVYVCV